VAGTGTLHVQHEMWTGPPTRRLRWRLRSVQDGSSGMSGVRRSGCSGYAQISRRRVNACWTGEPLSLGVCYSDDFREDVWVVRGVQSTAANLIFIS
jgi:hypothetical protein